MKTVSTPFGDGKVTFDRYTDNDRICISIKDLKNDSLLYVASVNLPYEDCPEGHVWIKTWGGNQGIDEMLYKAGTIDLPENFAKAGYATASFHKILVNYDEELDEELIQLIRKRDSLADKYLQSKFYILDNPDKTFSRFLKRDIKILEAEIEQLDEQIKKQISET